ncbi:MAG TPA: hypothetical protein PKD78_09670, partial [Saprospiraceae bacterium]|nr:hypothetical protein [Saprospiraceae bacterium]
MIRRTCSRSSASMPRLALLRPMASMGWWLRWAAACCLCLWWPAGLAAQQSPGGPPTPPPARAVPDTTPLLYAYAQSPERSQPVGDTLPDAQFRQ